MEKETQITEDQIKTILGDEFNIFMEKIIPNCFCGDCGVTTIIDYEIYVNDLYDVVLRGKCEKCKGVVARCVETGEDEECVRRINQLLN